MDFNGGILEFTVGASQVPRSSQQVTKEEHGLLAMGIKGTQPGQYIKIFQIQSMSLGGAKHQFSLEKEEDSGPAPYSHGA